MDEAIENFVAFTGASPEVARRYLGLTDNSSEQAIQLYFDSPDLASGADTQPAAPAIPSSTRPPRSANTNRIINVDSDDEDDLMDMQSEADSTEVTEQIAAVGRAADVEDDAAIARRMQEELYGEASGGLDGDGIRAPDARRTETLVGGMDASGIDPRSYMNAAVAEQMRRRQAHRGNNCFALEKKQALS